MNCKDIWDTRSEKTKKRKCRSAESSFQVNLSKMINLSLLYAACWRTSDDPFVSSGLIHDLFSSFKATTSTFLHSCLGVGHLCVRSLILPERLLFIVLTNSEMKYRPWQHTYLYQVARRVPSSNTKNINGLFLFYAQTQCFSPPWSSALGKLSTVLILLVCTDQDQICAYERLMNELLCLMKTSVKRCFLK